MTNADASTSEYRVNEVTAGYARGWTFTELNGKKPIHKGWQNAERETLEKALACARNGNVGLRTGKLSGIAVVDVDAKKGGKIPDLPETVQVRTPGGGWHFYFTSPNDVELSNGVLAPHVDFKTDGGCVVFPGSIHPDTGGVYEWEPHCSPEDVAVAPLPDWIIEHRKKPEKPANDHAPKNGFGNLATAIRYADRMPDSVENNGGDDQLYEFAKKAVEFGLCESDQWALMLYVNGAKCFPPWSESRLQYKLMEARKNCEFGKKLRERERGATDPETEDSKQVPKYEPFTELANAHRLERHSGADLLHHSALGWHYWKGSHWLPSAKAAHREAHRLGKLIRGEAAEAAANDPSLAKDYFKWARASESEHGITATLRIASNLTGIDADAFEFDGHGALLNCPNGTVDLRTGELRQHRRDDYLTKLCATTYVCEAQCPRWRKFLLEVFDKDEEIISYVQWWLGYSLSGETKHQCFCVFWGDGENGKGTLLNTFRAIIGADYGQQLDPEVLMRQVRAKHPTDIAALRGVRLAVANETQRGRRLNESLIKALTGGDSLRAHFMCKDSFEFTPCLKLVICSNYRPVIEDASHAMWRRIRLIPFERQFSGNDCNKNLKMELWEERKGILAWAVEGAQKAFVDEPPLPAKVQAATTNYQSEQDTLGQFLGEVCEKWEQAKVAKTVLYSAYSEWANGRCEGRNEFNNRIRRLGFEEGLMGHKNTRCWCGIALRGKDLEHEK